MPTPLMTRLGLGVPVIQAPMAGGWITPELVAAVAEAGGLGMLAGTRIEAPALRVQIEETRRRTRGRFGINFLVPVVTDQDRAGPLRHPVLDQVRGRLALPEPGGAAPAYVDVDQGLEIALEAGISIVSFAMGSPAPYVERLHAAGALVIGSATTVEEALEVEAAGADAVVAQGAEAGGHRGTFAPLPPGEIPLVGTMALVPQVVDAVRIPVIAAGGIMDGRGVVAALALGAQAAQLGTRFLLAAEAGTLPGYRRRLLEAVETDTVVTDAFTGRTARAIRNKLTDEFVRAGARPLPWPRQGSAGGDIYRASFAGDGEYAPMLAGQGLRLARRVQPAAEIMRELEADAARVTAALAG